MYVGIEILCQKVRIIQEPLKIELRCVIERSARGRFKKLFTESVRLMGVLLIGGEHRLFRICQNAVETSKHRQRQDDLPVLVALVRASQQVAYLPDEVS